MAISRCGTRNPKPSPQDKEKEYDRALSQVRFTPESKESYESRMGYSVEVIETGERNRGVIFQENEPGEGFLIGSEELKKRLVEGGIEAIVETNFSKTTGYASIFYYGLPVARKKGGAYR